MVQWKTILLLLAISAALAVIGCPGSRSIFSASRGATSVASGGKSSGTTTSEAHGTPASGPRHAWRDTTFAVYHNPDYGVTFRYPRNFALQEEAEAGDADSDSASSAAVEAQRQLTAEQPGALLVATVSIPSDAYPNTSFKSGALQFVVHPMTTAESCQAFAAPPEPGGDGASGTMSIQGVPFAWRDRSSGDADTRYERREYAGYAGGSCYEFRMEVGVSADPSTDAGIKAADTKKILRTLEKIVLSLQLHPAGAAAAGRASTTAPAAEQ